MVAYRLREATARVRISASRQEIRACILMVEEGIRIALMWVRFPPGPLDSPSTHFVRSGSLVASHPKNWLERSANRVSRAKPRDKYYGIRVYDNK